MPLVSDTEWRGVVDAIADHSTGDNGKDVSEKSKVVQLKNVKVFADDGFGKRFIQ